MSDKKIDQKSAVEMIKAAAEKLREHINIETEDIHAERDEAYRQLINGTLQVLDNL